jgi:hypothetical protein
MDQKTPTTSTDQTRIIKIMEEHQRPTEYKVVIEFLQNKMEALDIDENDVKKFDKIPGPNFLNLTKEELHRHFKLEYAQADDISNIVDALNLLRTAEHKLKRLNLSLESAIKLVKDLESEQRISSEILLKSLLLHNYNLQNL